MGLHKRCFYVEDGHSDRGKKMTKIWVSYISKKGQRYNCTVQCQIRHTLQGREILNSNKWDDREGMIRGRVQS